jgi:chromosome segregation ATPase
MKSYRNILTFVPVIALAVAAGCKPEYDRTVDASTNRNPATLSQVKEETREAIDATKDYAYAQKTEYAAKIRAELAELNKELDQLGAKIDSSSTTAKEEAKAKLQVVREKVASLNEKLEGVQGATESTWEEVKAGLKKGYEEVKESFRQARQWLSEKIAP